MVQTRTTDGGNSLRRHWLHGEQTNSKTGTAQRDPESILNHSQLFTDRKPGWYLKHQPGTPTAVVTPVRGQQTGRRDFPVFALSPQTFRQNERVCRPLAAGSKPL